MRAAVINRQGHPVAPNVRLVDDHPEPAAGPGEVVLRIEAAALNHLDLWVGRGIPGLSLEYPRISGSDGCGVIRSAGDGVDERWIGQRVILNAAVPQSPAPRPGRWPTMPELRMIGEQDPGCMAEAVAVPVANVVAVGPELAAAEVAAFGLTHLTAWRMLVTNAGLRHGQTVLITGIGGGVALAALGICAHFGCRTIVTSRHRWKLDRALAHGADEAILDTGEDWSTSVRQCTAGRGVDICVDSIGQAVHEPCMKSLTRGGAFVTCGCTSGPIASTNLARLFWLQHRMLGSTMGDMDEFRQAVALLLGGALQPIVDSVYEAEQVGDAYARLESGDQFGKVVVRWTEQPA